MISDTPNWSNSKPKASSSTVLALLAFMPFMSAITSLVYGYGAVKLIGWFGLSDQIGLTNKQVFGVLFLVSLVRGLTHRFDYRDQKPVDEQIRNWVARLLALLMLLLSALIVRLFL